MAWIGSVLGGIAFVILFALINGGYVYKTTCPLASGGSESSWTYAINDIIPYTRSTDAPCHGHTGTRLALSGIGIWPLGHSAKTHELTEQDQLAVESLRIATSEITSEYARERRVSSDISSEAKANGLTPALYRKLAKEMSNTTSHMQAIKDKFDTPIQASDSQLIDARSTLSEWLGYQVAVDKLFLTSSSLKEWEKQASDQYGAKINDSVQRLRFLSAAVQTRFPQVNAWSFLPAK
jgi:hypothetical protein